MGDGLVMGGACSRVRYSGGAAQPDHPAPCALRPTRLTHSSCECVSLFIIHLSRSSSFPSLDKKRGLCFVAPRGHGVQPRAW